MDIPSFLARIGYTGDTEPTQANLSALMKAHLLSVPFENLDIHLGRPIDLDNVFDKVVTRRRGGFCYELNYLFYQLLQALGYQATMASARVYNTDKKTFGQEFDHLVVLVSFDGKQYLADVGFGEFAFGPLALTMGETQPDARGLFRIEPHESPYLSVKKETDGTCDIDYIFTTSPRRITDFTAMCRYHQTSPDSHFTQNRLCSIATPNGRITLSGDELKIKEGEVVTKQRVDGEGEMRGVLEERFGVKIDS